MAQQRTDLTLYFSHNTYITAVALSPHVNSISLHPEWRPDHPNVTVTPPMGGKKNIRPVIVTGYMPLVAERWTAED
jgi:hypothetical protein